MRNRFLIFIILFALISSLCFAMDQNDAIIDKTVRLSSLENKYEKLLTEDSSNSTEWKALESELVKLISDGSYPSAKSSYLLGLIRYKQGDYKTAREYFNLAISLNGFSYLAELAYSNMAVCDEQLGNDSTAINDYKRLLYEYGKDSAVAPKALFNIGRLYVKGNNEDDAITVFRLLIDKYPNSEYAKLAQSFVVSTVYPGFSPRLFAELTEYLRTEDTIEPKRTDYNAWGYFDGNPILIEQNNVFYNTLVNDEDLQKAYLTGDYNVLLSSYHNAYQAQVLFVALTADADMAGIVAPNQLVDELIIASGVYNGDDGRFSEEVFNSKSEDERKSVNDFYSMYYPYSAVISDLKTTIVSEQEKAFVSDLASNTRSYEYFITDASIMVDSLIEKARRDFNGAAKSANAEIVTVSKCNNNPGFSQYLGDLTSNDPKGYLVKAIGDDTFATQVYVVQKGGVVGAKIDGEDGNSFNIVVRVSDVDDNDTSSSFVTGLLYDYYATTQPVYDRFYNVLSSNRHLDDFYVQFFNTLFSAGS